MGCLTAPALNNPSTTRVTRVLPKSKIATEPHSQARVGNIYKERKATRAALLCRFCRPATFRRMDHNIEMKQENNTEVKTKFSGLKHGHCREGKRSKEYVAWVGAKQRCTNPRVKQFKDYGGRGIKVCAEWLHDFAAFFAHVGPCPPGRSLDRIDNSKGYEPGNVQWSTRQEQAVNRRTSNQYIARRLREAASGSDAVISWPQTLPKAA